MAWDGSTRRRRLPPDWEARRSATAARAGGRCEGLSFDGEPRWHVDDCDGIGTDCDHDVAGDNHDLANLRWLSADCHKSKTAEEARRVRSRARRAPERHPLEHLT
jgi:hypothetical protein